MKIKRLRPVYQPKPDNTKPKSRTILRFESKIDSLEKENHLLRNHIINEILARERKND